MNKVTVRGASDDLIEIEGGISEEFGAYGTGDEKPKYLAFSDGTMLRVVYDNEGCWRITLCVQGTAAFEKREATSPEADYSDIVTLTGDLKAVMLGTHLSRARTAVAK